MSQIASFYLVKDGQKKEISDGDCSGDVYMAIWDYCEGELDIDCRINAPLSDETLDCVLIDSKMAVVNQELEFRLKLFVDRKEDKK